MKQCKYCGSTTNLVVTKVGNTKDKLREETLNICIECKRKLNSIAGSSLKKKPKELEDTHKNLKKKYSKVTFSKTILKDTNLLFYVFCIPKTSTVVMITTENISETTFSSKLPDSFSHIYSRFLIYSTVIPDIVLITKDLSLLAKLNQKVLFRNSLLEYKVL